MTKNEIKFEMKELHKGQKIVDYDFWDCMGDTMVAIITIADHVARRYTYCISSYDDHISRIGDARYL